MLDPPRMALEHVVRGENMAGFLETPSISLLERGLNTASLRHQVIADNLANVDTPGYKRKEVAFEDQLISVLEKGTGIKGVITHPKHIPIGISSPDEVVPRVSTQEDQEYRNDKNNVDIDREMAVMAKNTLWFEAMLTQISSKLSGLKNTIREVR